MSYTKRLLVTLTALALAGTAHSASAQGVVSRIQAPARGWLGISYATELTRSGTTTRERLVIEEVVQNSPAERGGLAVGDEIIAINDIRATAQLMSSLSSSLEPGDEVRVRVRRDGRERELRVRAGDVPAEYRARVVSPRVGTYFFDPDSLSGRIEIYLDSARSQLRAMPRFQLDTMRGGRGFFRDSVIVMPRGDSAFLWSGPGGVFRYMPGDSAWRNFRFYGPDATAFRFRMDSIIRFDLDSLRVSMRAFEPEWNMRFDTLYRGPGDFGIAILGNRAIAGAELTELNPELGEYFGTTRGVLVVRVPEDTPADRAGLEAGDVITAVNGRNVSSVSELRREIARVGRDPARLEVVRRNSRRTIELRQ